LLIARKLGDARRCWRRRRGDEATAGANDADGVREVSGVRVSVVEGDAATGSVAERDAGRDLENGDPVARRDLRLRIQQHQVRGHDVVQELRGWSPLAG